MKKTISSLNPLSVSIHLAQGNFETKRLRAQCRWIVRYTHTHIYIYIMAVSSPWWVCCDTRRPEQTNIVSISMWGEGGKVGPAAETTASLSGRVQSSPAAHRRNSPHRKFDRDGEREREDPRPRTRPQR